MEENPYNPPKCETSKHDSRRHMAMIVIGGALLGLVAGGTAGGFIGFWLGDLGAGYDPENVGFVSFVIGAAVGLAIAMATSLRRTARLPWGFAMLLGAGLGAAVAATFILLVSWIRRP